MNIVSDNYDMIKINNSDGLANDDDGIMATMMMMMMLAIVVVVTMMMMAIMAKCFVCFLQISCSDM